MKNLILLLCMLLGVVTTFSQEFLGKSTRDIINSEYNFFCINDSIFALSDAHVTVKLLVKDKIVVAEQYKTKDRDNYATFVDFMYEHYTLIEADGDNYYFKNQERGTYCLVYLNTFTFTKEQ